MKSQTHLTTLPTGALAPHGHNPLQSFNDHPAVAGFLAARQSLQQRQKELEAELQQVRKLLGDEPAADLNTNSPAAMPPVTRPPLTPQRRSNAGLRQALITLLANGPLTKDQIVEQLLARKFEFFGKPKPALDCVLYTKRFRREGKLFGLAPLS